MRGQKLLRRTSRKPGKPNLATEQADMRRHREPELVIAVHEHAEHAGTADDRNGAVTHACLRAGSFEGRTRGIPRRGFRIERSGRDRVDLMRQDDALAPWRVRLVLEGIAT